MTITYARETYEQVIGEIQVLLPVHWREMALYQDDILLEPNYTFYKAAMETDMCRIYTVRSDGYLVGYVIFFVTPRHLHYRHRWVKDDTIWIHPDHRNAGVGNGLFDFFEADLTKDGPVVIQIETRVGHPALVHLCEQRGYGVTGTLFGKRFS